MHTKACEDSIKKAVEKAIKKDEEHQTQIEEIKRKIVDLEFEFNVSKLTANIERSKAQLTTLHMKRKREIKYIFDNINNKKKNRYSSLY